MLSRTALLAIPAALGALLVQGPAAVAGTASQCTSSNAVYQSSPTWSQAVLRASSLWPLTQGRHARVAVLSTGIDQRNAQFPAGSLDAGGDVIGTGRSPRQDCDGRGTFLAGLVAARPAAATTFAGVAPAATLIPIRVVETVTGEGGTTQQRGGTAEAIAAGIRLAVHRHATVVCVPLEVADDSAALRSAVEAATAAGALVVAGGQLSAEDASGVRNPHAYPAEYPDVLVADAIDGRGGVSRPTPHPPAGGEIAAPGTDLVSTAAGPGAEGLGHIGPRSDPGGAVALVAGVAALVQSYRPDLIPGDLRARLVATGEPLAGGRGAPPLRLVDAYAAVTSDLVTMRQGGYGTRAVPQVVPDGQEVVARRALTLALLLLGLAGLAVVCVLTVWSPRARPDPGTHAQDAA
jgi:membrane-anchored mycosin MYCP